MAMPRRWQRSPNRAVSLDRAPIPGRRSSGGDRSTTAPSGQLCDGLTGIAVPARACAAEISAWHARSGSDRRGPPSEANGDGLPIRPAGRACRACLASASSWAGCLALALVTRRAQFCLPMESTVARGCDRQVDVVGGSGPVARCVRRLARPAFRPVSSRRSGFRKLRPSSERSQERTRDSIAGSAGGCIGLP